MMKHRGARFLVGAASRRGARRRLTPGRAGGTVGGYRADLAATGRAPAPVDQRPPQFQDLAASVTVNWGTSQGSPRW